MFIADFGTDKTNVAPRTAEGEKGLKFPVTGNDETHLTLSGCAGCSKREDHGLPCSQIGMRPVLNQKRHQNVTATEQANAEFLQRVQSGLWIISYIANGLIKWSPFNLFFSTANNIAQNQNYEITGCDGNTLTIKGRNPNVLKSPLSITNTNYPFEYEGEKPPDISQEDWDGTPGLTDGLKYARLIPSGIYHVLPAGSLVSFGYPSVLFGKLEPYITKIIPPESEDIENVEFDIELSHSVDYAMTPYDSLFPPSDGKYYCSIWFYSVAPEKWANVQTPQETWFTKGTKTVSAEDFISADGIVSLTKTDSTGSKVLFPSWGTDLLVVKYRQENQPVHTLTIDDSYLTTTQAGSTFASSIDLSELLILTDLESVAVYYCPEAVAGDSYIVPFQKTCSNDQQDWTGSYVHSNGRRCQNVSCDKFADSEFVGGNCWKTANADKFTLGTETGNFPLTDTQRSAFINRAWSRCSFVLEQGMPGDSGFRNFAYNRPADGGPSLQELVGGYFDTVPNGFFPRRSPVFPARFGQRREFVNGSGDLDHEVVLGLFEARNYDDEGYAGACLEYVPDWDSRLDQNNGALSTVDEMFPLSGPSAMHVYNYDLLSNGMPLPKRLSADAAQMFVTGLSKTKADTILEAEITNLV